MSSEQESSGGSISGMVPARVAAGVISSGAPTVEAKFDFWRSAHRALRGRYLIAVILATCGLIIGARVGFQMGQKVYSAIGLVRIASVLPEVMHETDQNRPMAMFDGFIAAQRDVMVSRDVIEAAMQQETWRNAQRRGHAPSDTQFAATLKVEVHPRSDHLKILFTDGDPEIAAAAVQSVIAAYQRTYVSEQDSIELQRIAKLKARHASLAAELNKLDGEIHSNGSADSAAELDAEYAVASDCEKKLRAALLDVQCAIAGVHDLNERPASTETPPAEVADHEFLQAAVNAVLRAQSDLDAALEHGMGPAHPRVIQLQGELAQSRQRLEEQMRHDELMRANSPTSLSPASLAERQTSLKRLMASTEKEMARIAERQAQLATFTARYATVQQDLKETDARLDSLATEASLGSRLTVISNGEKPIAPSLDNRAKFAAVGALGGGALPIAAMILFGSIRRRYRYGDELAEDLQHRVPFVALMPEVAVGGELNSAACHCVHELRALLQPAKSKDPRVYLVASASAGEGATSLCLSMALSFAATGCRTLIVDANLKSRQLSVGFDAGTMPGLLESIAGGESPIHRMGSGVCLLPSGRARFKGSLKLNSAALGAVLADLRSRYDVVLIDGEPIVTGLSWAALAPQSNGVLLMIGRGQEQAMVASALKQIETVGGTLAGVVFNRASESDFPVAMREKSSSASPEKSSRPARLERFGPMVGRMLESLSLSRETDLELVSPTDPRKRLTESVAA